jgi:hypothetical protein
MATGPSFTGQIPDAEIIQKNNKKMPPDRIELPAFSLLVLSWYIVDYETDALPTELQGLIAKGNFCIYKLYTKYSTIDLNAVL